jgi:hypothetical protein
MLPVPRDGDRVIGLPYNADGRHSDDLDVHTPFDKEPEIEGTLRFTILDTPWGSQTTAMVFTDDGKSRTVEPDTIVLVQSNANARERIAKLKEGN